ncbi:MAG: hypothetical protein A2W29_11015, partial [Gemmatimonadetes bacterium RBG_16_66_8]
LAGRRAGSPGAGIAAEYLASACRALGLAPVDGDGFFQSIPLVQVAIQRSRLEVVRDTERAVFEGPQDFVTDLDLGSSFTGFAGPAMRLEELAGTDSVPDVRGAIVITESLRDRGVLDVLGARGAAGLILAVRDPERYDLYARSRGTTRLLLADRDAQSSLLRPLPTIVVGPAAAEALLGPAAGPRGSISRIEVQVDVVRSRVPDQNVICLLMGADPRARDTAIVFTAHFDHLGIGIPDARGDSIYNGFSDNAAGVAMLLAVARALQQPRYIPAHSILFLFPAAEEQGLLGSDYYTAHPRWPLKRTLAAINLDAGAPPGPPSTWRLAGVPGSPLALLASDVAHIRGWSATVTEAGPNSDHYPLLAAGVSAIFVIPGPGPYEGMSMDSSRALKSRWDAYHQSGDEWSEAFPLSGLARYAEYALLIAHALDRGLTDPGDRSRHGPRRHR